MTFNNSLKLILLFIGSFISFYANNCISDPGLPYYHLFDQNLVLGEESSPKKFNIWHYPNQYSREHNAVSLNTNEWIRFFDGKYTEDDLVKVIYRNGEFQGYREEFINLQSKKTKNISIDQKEKEFILYLEYALELESYLETLIVDPWNSDPVIKDPVKQEFMVEKATTLLHKVRSVFIKERIYYQLIKLHRYFGSYDEVLKVYESHFKGLNSFISFWAMDQYAGVLRLLGRKAEANYYFSKVYVGSPSVRGSAYLSIDIQSEGEFDEVKNMGATAEELMSLHFIRGMNGKNLGLYDLEKIVDIDSKSDFARILMSREINRLETFFLNKNDNFYPVYDNGGVQKLVKQGSEDKYLDKLITLNNQLLSQENSNGFWHLSAAYLYFLKGDYEKSYQLLSGVSNIEKSYQKQRDILNLLIYLKRRPHLSFEEENHIGEQLYKISNGEVYYQFYETREFSFCLNEYIFDEISKRDNAANNEYLKLIFGGQTIFRDLYLREGNSISVAYIDRLLEDLKKVEKTKLVEYASSYYFSRVYYWTDEQAQKANYDDVVFFLKELRAVYLMRDPERLKEALSEMDQIPERLLALIPNTKTAANPFVFYTKDPYFEDYGTEYENSVPDEMKFNRREIIKTLKRLYENAKQDNNADDYFKLGLAYYNMSYYGVSWSLMGYFRQSSGENGFFDMTVSKQFFEKALNAGGLDREMAAKAHFMLARCDQNIFCEGTSIGRNYVTYYGDYINDFDRYQRAIRQSGYRNHFEILQNNYSRTKFYKELIKECKYFDYYVSGL